MSSAEVVLGMEGSAFHTPLLLRDPVQTRFWALTRHRAGAGVFEHIRRAKGLRYETLNFLGSAKLGGHRWPLNLDLEALEDALDQTDGLTRNARPRPRRAAMARPDVLREPPATRAGSPDPR